jgi:hypothetical protein
MCSLFSVALHRTRTQVLRKTAKATIEKRSESISLIYREVPVDRVRLVDLVFFIVR